MDVLNGEIYRESKYGVSIDIKRRIKMVKFEIEMPDELVKKYEEMSARYYDSHNIPRPDPDMKVTAKHVQAVLIDVMEEDLRKGEAYERAEKAQKEMRGE